MKATRRDRVRQLEVLMTTFAKSVIVAVGFTFVASGMVFADILIYERVAGISRRVGRVETDTDGDFAIICGNGSCNASPCLGCHTQSPSYKKYTKQEHELHLTRYFPRMELRLGEGQETTFGGHKLRRERGRLVFVDGTGGRRPLPAGALLLKGNNGEPFAIISSNPPE
jgi:hypothetical protein